MLINPRTTTLARDDRGQGSVEYVLVMLVAAAIAWSLVKWIQGGGTNGLMDSLGGWLGSLIGMLW